MKTLKKTRTITELTATKQVFIDLFAGCGGLSLGLMQSGWEGIFAIEKNSDAFKTLEHNLLNHPYYSHSWPEWLPKENIEIGQFIKKYKKELEKLRGKVDLIAGGPPCQGFSLLGKRDKDDPRNKLFKHYVALVNIVRPSFLLLENVKGISIAHGVDKWGTSNFINTEFLISPKNRDTPYPRVVEVQNRG